MVRRIVKVDLTNSEDGTVKPSVVYWSDGRHWRIKRVLHETVLSNCASVGVRYTVLIGSAEKYIYRDSKDWYVVLSS